MPGNVLLALLADAVFLAREPIDEGQFLAVYDACPAMFEAAAVPVVARGRLGLTSARYESCRPGVIDLFAHRRKGGQPGDAEVAHAGELVGGDEIPVLDGINPAFDGMTDPLRP